MPVASLDRRVPSNVSNRASCKRKLRWIRLIMVELSLRMRRTVVKIARGPFMKTMIASWGKYVKKNMEPKTPAVSPRVGRMREVNGFHSERCVRK
jgi:hypothetical protein